MGSTTERILSKLCVHSFLSLWSHPNPYTDRGFNERKEGKELCDLLVVFGDDVLIFSDKECAYGDSGDEELDWKRWYKKAVGDSARQLIGAERWLRENPSRIFADSKCSLRLPVEIPPLNRARFHRIAIALGARDRCIRYFAEGTGSLLILSDPEDPADLEVGPFCIGKVGHDGRLVHVFDEFSLRVAMEELDTAEDFCTYLKKKEALFATKRVNAHGEEELIAHYLMNASEANENDFIPKQSQFDGILLAGGALDRLRGLPQYKNSKIVNRPSYAWDSLIEYFTTCWRRGTLENVPSTTDLEEALRLMARPGRVIRRRLGGLLMNAIDEIADHPRMQAYYDPVEPYTAYAVVGVPTNGIPAEHYMDFRAQMMMGHARSIKIREPGVQQVLSIGLTPKASGGGSETIALVDLSNWTPEIERDTREFMKSVGIGVAGTRETIHTYPLPEPPVSREMRRRLRQKAALEGKSTSPKP